MSRCEIESVPQGGKVYVHCDKVATHISRFGWLACDGCRSAADVRLGTPQARVRLAYRRRLRPGAAPRTPEAVDTVLVSPPVVW